MPDTPETKPSITPDEQARRQAAIDYARASVRLEGFVWTPEQEALFARYVAGELSRDELNAEVLRMANVAKPDEGLLTGNRIAELYENPV